ncbi:MAG: ABC transporter ATP-binding protein [Alteromonadaceae bacterium]|nr:MAG: ABC transporter ATP-binding protein [Alteromonadaceae bacterium]
MAVIPAVLIPIFFFGKRVRRLAEGSQAAVADVGTYAGEVIQNIKVVQSYTSEEREQQAFDKEVESAFEVAKKRIKQRSFLISVVIMLAFSAISIMLWVGGMDVLNNKITGGELGAFVFYALMVAMSVATIAEVYGQLQRAAGSATRLLELLEITSDIQSPDSPREINIGSSTKTSNSSTSNALSFENVSFHYPTRPDSAALKEINLDIKKGQVVAFVGTSGAGKSTLFELLQRFYDPQQGCIKINDCPLQEADVHALRRSMGTVAQQPVLFSANVWHNIRYGRPEASDEEVIDAARKAHAHEFIEQLPGGYASDLGEKGVRLSGGQKQRIALARAILKDPEILLLDEATSALDAESEYHVQQALNTLMTGRTTLIIAHRLATVLHADEIVVMSEGRIVDKGDHKSLLKSCAIYQRLCELQFDA